jgi:hypothetical protein
MSERTNLGLMDEMACINGGSYVKEPPPEN